MMRSMFVFACACVCVPQLCARAKRERFSRALAAGVFLHGLTSVQVRSVTSFANPKSVIFMWPSLSIKIFSGFKSLQAARKSTVLARKGSEVERKAVSMSHTTKTDPKAAQRAAIWILRDGCEAEAREKRNPNRLEQRDANGNGAAPAGPRAVD